MANKPRKETEIFKKKKKTTLLLFSCIGNIKRVVITEHQAEVL